MGNSYFTHDSNARNSKKLLRLRMRHGAAGYGVYFMLLERLREESGYTCDADYEMLQYDLRAEPELIKSVVEDFGLFIISKEDNRFYSAGFEERMQLKDSIKSRAGIKGAESRWGKKDETPVEMAQNGTIDGKPIAENVCHDFANGSTSDKEKKSKEKESKENIFSPQTPPLPDGKEGEEKKEFSYPEKTQILFHFVQQNFPQPEEEYDKLVSYNNMSGRNWDKMDAKARIAAARLWKPRPEKPPRFCRQLAEFWAELIEAAMSIGAPVGIVEMMLSDKVDLRISGNKLNVRCAHAVTNLIEGPLIYQARMIFNRYTALKALELEYTEYA